MSACRQAVSTVARRAIRAWCRWTVAHRLQVEVEGIEHVPVSGPVLIVSRHFHHLYDGVVYLALVPRQVHILVALDWAWSRPLRHLMEWACRLAGWPIVLRAERLRALALVPGDAAPSAYKPQETIAYLRRGLRDSVDVLRRGDVLVVFPEAYPNIDPISTPKSDSTSFLPFRSGFVRLALAAQRDGLTRVAVVPAGLHYSTGAPWQIRVRFAAPLMCDRRTDSASFVALVEDMVRALSSDVGLTLHH